MEDTSSTSQWFLAKLQKALLSPIKAIKKRYIPLLFIYFSYGLSGFSAIALSFWEKENLTLSAEQLIAISVWVMVPWTLKMVFGHMVDSVKIFGSQRRVYIFIGAILMIIGSLMLVGLAGKYDWVMWIGSEYLIYMLSSLLTAFGFVIQDVTADTMSTEVVERTEQIKDKIVKRSTKDIHAELTMIQLLGRISLMSAAFVVAWLGGYLAGVLEYETIFWLTLLIPLISCIGVLFIKLEKPKEHERKPINLKIIIGGLAFAVFSVIMAVADVPYAQELVFAGSLILLSAMMYLITKNLSRKVFTTIVCALAMIFLYRAASLSGVGPGLQWWLIDDLSFDPNFFGILRQIGAATAILVLWFLSDFIASKSIRSVFIFLVIIGTVMSMPEILVYYHVHELLNLEPRTIFLFDTALESPLTQISMVPMLGLIAFYAPAGYRGTWFAIGASLMNLALSGGALLTKYLNKIFIITREVLDETGNIITERDYSELGNLMIIKTLIAFIIPLLAIFLLLRKPPPVAQTQEIEENIIEDLSDEAPIPQQKDIDI